MTHYVRTLLLQEWKSLCAVKARLYAAISYFYMAVHEEEKPDNEKSHGLKYVVHSHSQLSLVNETV